MTNNQQKRKSVARNVENADDTANSVKGETQIANDAKFWLTQVQPEHFTWLNDEAKQKVKLAKDLKEFWALEKVHQDNVPAVFFFP